MSIGIRLSRVLVLVTIFVYCFPSIDLQLFGQSSGKEAATKSIDSHTVDSVLEDYVEALGGQMTLNSIETVKHQLRYSGGTIATGHQYSSGTRFVSIGEYEGHGSHSKLYQDGIWYRTSKGAKPHRISTQSNINTAFTFHHCPCFSMQLKAQANQQSILSEDEYLDSDFAECICLISDEKEKPHLRRFFDRKSGLLVGIESWQSRNEGQATYYLQSKLEYEDVEGVLVVCRSIRKNKKGWETECLFENYEINIEIDESVFEVGELEPVAESEKEDEDGK